MLESRTLIQVRFAETDMMGIVYHGSYIPWLEVGRTRLFEEFGFNYRKLHEAGYHVPVLDLSIKYLSPARYDDEVTVKTVVREKPGIRIKIEYEILRGDQLLVTARTQHAFINHAGAPTRPPADFLAACTRHFSGAG